MFGSPTSNSLFSLDDINLWSAAQVVKPTLIFTKVDNFSLLKIIPYFYSDVKHSLTSKSSCYVQYIVGNHGTTGKSVPVDKEGLYAYQQFLQDVLAILPISFKFRVIPLLREEYSSWLSKAKNGGRERIIDFWADFSKTFLIPQRTMEEDTPKCKKLVMICYTCTRQYHPVALLTEEVNQPKLPRELTKFIEAVIHIEESEYLISLFHIRHTFQVMRTHDTCKTIPDRLHLVKKCLLDLHEAGILDTFNPEPLSNLFFSWAPNVLKLIPYEHMAAFFILPDLLGLLNATGDLPSWQARIWVSIPEHGEIPKPYETDRRYTVLSGRVEYNFLTCDGVQEILSYKMYTNPFDEYIWVAVGISLVSLGCLIGAPSGGKTVENVFNFGATLLEQSSSLKSGGREELLGVNIITKGVLVLWGISCIILVNGYKATFTTEIVSPFQTSSKYQKFNDIANFTYFFSIPKWIYEIYEKPLMSPNPLPDPLYFLSGWLKSPICWQKDFAMAMSNQENGVCGKCEALTFSHPEHFWGNLSHPKCKGRVYVDTRVNVENTLRYTGKVSHFKKGKEPVAGSYTGWSMGHFRSGHMFLVYGKRIQIFMSSGIHSYWANLYRMFVRDESFQDFDTDKRSGFGKYPVQKLGLDSNVLSSFYILIALCALSLGVCIVERLTPMYTKVEFVSLKKTLFSKMRFWF